MEDIWKLSSPSADRRKRTDKFRRFWWDYRRNKQINGWKWIRTEIVWFLSRISIFADYRNFRNFRNFFCGFVRMFNTNNKCSLPYEYKCALGINWWFNKSTIYWLILMVVENYKLWGIYKSGGLSEIDVDLDSIGNSDWGDFFHLGRCAF